MLASTHWASPSQDLFLSLSPGVVHVWRAHLEDSPLQASRYLPYLAADERARAERFRVPHPQYQFVSSRGILRRLLSHYVGVPAANLRFETNPQGKPALADPSSLPLQFNVSHTSGVALLAITVEHAVGIDVEKIDRVLSNDDIAARYFSPREAAHLASLSPDLRTRAFFTYWTCKEAYLKMRGIGLSGGLDQCEISLDPDGVKANISLTDRSSREDECSLFRAHAGQAHIGALAVNCPSVEVSFWDWQD
ncbi:MAG: 4'-phosphopantetheinyl transferase superfamily protein [Nitrospirota bacterium]|jgi:4'-phosphopantetheinyl transferase|nr:4'-phosphopantetheinyl transferase superfamily protein [Nitrospirota bacterium]MDH5296654.1 4'-phosphopantetheinyl transferase superfamily protein [Nitrospirota bacterium]MDH5576086.1 4'-phosphopantetheinyl transferase superfamily protein [Nitrospirota bacterium]